MPAYFCEPICMHYRLESFRCGWFILRMNIQSWGAHSGWRPLFKCLLRLVLIISHLLSLISIVQPPVSATFRLIMYFIKALPLRQHSNVHGLKLICKSSPVMHWYALWMISFSIQNSQPICKLISCRFPCNLANLDSSSCRQEHLIAGFPNQSHGR